MARNKHAAEHDNHERWLISYADFITLLFAFFVVMFASSQTDKSKARQISDSVTQAFEKGAIRPAVKEILGGTVDDTGKGNAMMKGPGGSQKQSPKHDIPPEKVAATDLTPSMKYLTQELAAEIKAGKLDVRLESRGLIISLRQTAYFPSGGTDVPSQAYPSLDKIASVIRGLPSPVRLEGHTDSIPIHNDHFRSNWELSAARSIAMLQIFTERYGIPRERLGIAGYADNLPIDSNDTPVGREHNRRVDIAILNQQVIVSTEPGGQPPASPRSGR